MVVFIVRLANLSKHSKVNDFINIVVVKASNKQKLVLSFNNTIKQPAHKGFKILKKSFSTFSKGEAQINNTNLKTKTYISGYKPACTDINYLNKYLITYHDYKLHTGRNYTYARLVDWLQWQILISNFNVDSAKDELNARYLEFLGLFIKRHPSDSFSFQPIHEAWGDVAAWEAIRFYLRGLKKRIGREYNAVIGNSFDYLTTPKGALLVDIQNGGGLDLKQENTLISYEGAYLKVSAHVSAIDEESRWGLFYTQALNFLETASKIGRYARAMFNKKYAKANYLVHAGCITEGVKKGWLNQIKKAAIPTQYLKGTSISLNEGTCSGPSFDFWPLLKVKGAYANKWYNSFKPRRSTPIMLKSNINLNVVCKNLFFKTNNPSEIELKVKALLESYKIKNDHQ